MYVCGGFLCGASVVWGVSMWCVCCFAWLFLVVIVVVVVVVCRQQEVFYTKLPSLEIAILPENYLELVWMLTKEIRLLFISLFIHLKFAYVFLFVYQPYCYLFPFFLSSF